MSTSPKAVVSAVYDAMNTRDLEVFDRFYDPEVTLNGQPSSPEELKGYCRAYLDAFEDLHLTVEHLVGDGDWVAARVVGRGTHTNALDNIAATGNHVEIAQHDLVRVSGGRIVECVTLVDQLALMQQLDAIPAG